MQQGTPDIQTVLQELVSIAEECGYDALRQKVEEELRKLEEEIIYLVVLGQFKRGKTSLINALLGVSILPVGVIPVTSVITLIKYGQEKCAFAYFYDGTKKSISIQDIGQYITESKNPNNVKKVDYVEVFYPSVLLQKGIVLVDTPGIGSIFEHNTLTTEEFIPKIDAAFVVLSPDPPITKAEQQFLVKTKQHVNKLFVVFNKIDIMQQNDLTDLFIFTTDILSSVLGADGFKMFPMSGLKAFEAKQSDNADLLQESGILNLEESIKKLASSDKEKILSDRSLVRTLSLINELRFAHELELKALLMPAKELDDKIKEFEQRSSAIDRERENFNLILENKIKKLQQEIEKEVTLFGSNEIKILEKSLNEEGFRRKDVNEIQKTLSQRMISDFDTWRNQYEPTIREQYQKIVDDYFIETNKHIQYIEDLSKSLFDIAMTRYDEADPLIWQGQFYYRVEKDHFLFKIPSDRLIYRILPDKKRNEFIAKILLKDISRNIKKTCSNLSYEYCYSLQEAFRRYKFEINQKFSSTTEEISTILDKTKSHRQDTEDTLSRPIESIHRKIEELSSLQRRLEIQP